MTTTIDRDLAECLERLKTKDRIHYRDAVHRLKRRGEEGFRAFMAAMRDADEFEGMYLIEAAIEIGAEIVPFLVAEMNALNSAVKGYCLAALGEIRDARAIPALPGAFADPDPYVRLACLQAMSKFPPGTFRRTLIAGLDDPDRRVRGFAAGLCGDGREAEAAPALILLLAEEDPDIRAISARSLGKIGSPEAVPALARLIDDASPIVASSAVLALGDIHAAGCFEPVRRSLRHAHELVRSSAVKALGRLRDPRGASELKSLPEDPNAIVRDLVRDTLSFLESEA